MEKLTTPGVFRARIDNSSVGLQKNNGFPQVILRFIAFEKYIEAVDELEHYKLAEPGFVGYPEKTVTVYQTLFNSADSFTTDGPNNTAYWIYRQLKIATDWNGLFSSLSDDSLNNKVVLIRMENNAGKDGKTYFNLAWLDHTDASPTPKLRKLDAAVLTHLDSLLKSAGPNKVRPATIVAPPPPPTKVPAKTVLPTAKPATVASAPALKADCTRDEAFASVYKAKGNLSDSDLVDQWNTIIAEVAPGLAEEELTDTQWADVRDVLLTSFQQ